MQKAPENVSLMYKHYWNSFSHHLLHHHRGTHFRVQIRSVKQRRKGPPIFFFEKAHNHYTISFETGQEWGQIHLLISEKCRKCIGCLYARFILKHEATNPETLLARGQITTLNWHLANYGKILQSNSGNRENCKTHKSQVLLALSSRSRLQGLGQCSPNHRLTPDFLHCHSTSVSFP